MLDNKDRELLRLLQLDCTLGLQELSNAVELTPNPCWKRIKRLEDSGFIHSRVAILNKEKLNLRLTAFMMIRTGEHTPEWFRHFVNVMVELPEITEIHRTTGDYDYLLHIVVADLKSYDQFYTRLINSVTGISNVTSSFSMNEIKNTTQLPLPLTIFR